MDAKEETKPEIDDKFWDLLMSAEKKDYETICAQYGVTDFRGMLKKLNEKKIEREIEQEKVCLIFNFFWKNKTEPNKVVKIHFNCLFFYLQTGCGTIMQPETHRTER